jgi:phosphatidylglycerophosphatase A
MQFLKYIATLGFIGYVPFAPGTFGTLLACFLFVLINPSNTLHVAILLVIIPLGIISSHCAEIVLKDKDSRHIVIDELCGYFIAMLFLPFEVFYIIGAFLLFRFFDILKPFPIRSAGHVFRGGMGIMADDIIAALYTNMILQIVRLV